VSLYVIKYGTESETATKRRSTDADKKAAAQLLAHFSSITDFTI
jgi:hypothetical protein